MAEGPNVSFRFGDLDKAALEKIAERLQISKSAVMRGLVRETWKIIQEQSIQSEPRKTIRPRATARVMK